MSSNNVVGRSLLHEMFIKMKNIILTPYCSFAVFEGLQMLKLDTAIFLLRTFWI